MQENEKTGKPEIECITCINNKKICDCIIYSGDLKAKNLYERRK